MSDRLIADAWRALAAHRRTALIPYVTAGFPSAARTADALRMLEAEGADLIEVGVPFSDPLADGPVIQRSTQAALEAGMTVRAMLAVVRSVRPKVPVIAFSYVNPILAYGVTRFLADGHAAGIAGLLLTDLPAGADPALEAEVAASPLALIRLLAPTTTGARLREAVRGAEGFLYLIARLGVTGAPTTVTSVLEGMVRTVRAETDLPLAVGFGIASGDQARRVAAFADGVIVGSALVERLGREGIEGGARLMRELRGALDTVAAA